MDQNATEQQTCRLLVWLYTNKTLNIALTMYWNYDNLECSKHIINSTQKVSVKDITSGHVLWTAYQN